MSEHFCAQLDLLPEPLDPETSLRLNDGLLNDTPSGIRLSGLADRFPAVRRLIDLVYDSSPHLVSLMEREPDVFAEILENGPDGVFAEAVRMARDPGLEATEDEVMSALRRAKARASLAIAVADLSRAWSVMEVTDALTRFADAALNGALDWLFAKAARDGKWTPAAADRPSASGSYVVLAMGKYGAYELNYSSDIDLIVFYDPQTECLADDVEPAKFFVRITRGMVKLLQDRTRDGYVFRVDLRLRPDPRATNVAIAMEAAAQYYESLGQNWERAAMIKARAAAGDIAAGEAFLKRLAPFVWRKYLDYAAIADVHSMKRQIHAFKGHGEIAVYGHNIKLGRGGIREIEFFVQTQQLIAGGRAPHLRGRGTLDMLATLAENDWIEPGVAEDMREAYLYLRHVEHRIQMQADEQTHSLPADVEALERFSRFAGEPSRDVFAARLLQYLDTVQNHYAALFEHAPSLGDQQGSLVFTGGDDDPDTIETLYGMGFSSPSEVSAAIRGWHFGRYPATRSARAKEKLTELMPALLRALSRTSDPDRAFLSFDRFVAGLPAGVQLFSLLWSNPKLLELLANVMGTAPRLAGMLGRKPQVLDAVLDPDYFGPLPDRAQFDELVGDRIRGTGSLEAGLDLARQFGNEQYFRIGVQVLTGTASASEAGAAYSALAETIIDGLLDCVIEDMALRHGRMPGGRVAIVAMGKLGGREMTAASDLDLMLVYDHDEDAQQSDGDRPLMAGTYFARLTQRLISALSAPTAEGSLYEVDMRLRPSGNSGPIATRLATFVDYQNSSAWTWEKLALTRARAVAGDAGLRDRISDAIRDALCRPRDRKATTGDVRSMRERIDGEKGSTDPWELKYVRGGLVDLEFTVQYLQIVHAADRPEILSTNTAEAISNLHDAGLLHPDQHDGLVRSCALLHRLTQILRLSMSGKFEAATAPEGLRRLLARAGDAPDFNVLESTLSDTEAETKKLYEQIVN